MGHALLPLIFVLAQSRTGFAVDRFEPVERGNAWFVVDALEIEKKDHPAIGLTLDYAYKSLAVQDENGGERFALVRHQTFVHAGTSFVFFERLRLGLDVPFAIYQDGEDGVAAGEPRRAATRPAMGDVRLAADLRLSGAPRGPFVLAAGARVWAPTGVRSQFTGDGSIRFGPQVLAAGELGALSWAARMAFVHRTGDDDYAGSPIGPELTGGAGIGVNLFRRRVFLGPEVFGATALGDGFAKRASPVEALAGAHVTIIAGLRAAIGSGFGITGGYGSPAFRLLASLEWFAPHEGPPPDRDTDGIRDEEDACPDVPGVRDADPTANGCPPPPPIPAEDADGDGVSDTDDACPTVAGMKTDDPMTNGCPPSQGPRPLAVVTKSEIKIGEQIRFATDSADLIGDSDAVLGAVKRLLDEHPEIEKVRIEGHTDTTGDPAYNDELSARRAAAVSKWLVDHGVDAKRLESAGFGSRKPIDSNDTEAGRAKNRRVVFTILRR